MNVFVGEYTKNLSRCKKPLRSTKGLWDKRPSCWDHCDCLSEQKVGGEQKVAPFCCALKGLPESTQRQTYWCLSLCTTSSLHLEELWIAGPNAHHSYFSTMKQTYACVKEMVQKSDQSKKSLKGFPSHLLLSKADDFWKLQF